MPVDEFDDIASTGKSGNVGFGVIINNSFVIAASYGFSAYDKESFQNIAVECKSNTFLLKIINNASPGIGILYGLGIGISTFDVSANSPSPYSDAQIDEMVQKGVISYSEGIALRQGSSSSGSDTYGIASLELGISYRIDANFSFYIKDRYNAVFEQGLSSNDILLGVALHL